MILFEEWKAGYIAPRSCDRAMADAWEAGQYALNSELAISANEAAKDARRKVAVEKINAIFAVEQTVWAQKDERSSQEILESLIKEAQG